MRSPPCRDSVSDEFNESEARVNWPLYFSTFSLIFIAELPDKTALATLLLATRGRPIPIFLGVALAFLVQTVVAVAFGGLLGLLPQRWVHVGAGVLFLGFAVHFWRARGGDSPADAHGNVRDLQNHSFGKDVRSAFIVIFIAEWGDLTQLATASLAAHYSHMLTTIFVASVCALWCVAALAVFIGSGMARVLEGRWLHYVGTFVFAAVGVYFLALAFSPHSTGQ